MSKTAEQAWRNYCKKWVDCNPEGASLMAISDFKQAVRQSIENEIQRQYREKGVKADQDGSVGFCLWFIDKMDTVTPTKE